MTLHLHINQLPRAKIKFPLQIPKLLTKIITIDNNTNNNTNDNNFPFNPVTSTEENISTNMITSNIDFTEDLTHLWQLWSTIGNVGISMGDKDSASAGGIEDDYGIITNESQLKTPSHRATNVVNLTPCSSIFGKFADLNVLMAPEAYKRTLPKKKKNGKDES